MNNNILKEEIIRLDALIQSKEEKNALKSAIPLPQSLESHLLDVNKTDLTNRPEIKAIVDPFLTERKVICIYAKPKVGKTWWALYLMLCVAAGKSFHKFEAFKRKVLYIDGEMTLDEIVMRKEKICKGNIISLPDDNFFIYSKDEYPMDFVDPRSSSWMNNIKKMIMKFDVIVFDNLSSIFGSSVISENDPRSFQPLRELFAYIKSKRKTAIFLHHESKSGGSPRGTSTLEGSIDGAMKLDKIECENQIETSFKLTFQLYRGERDERMSPLGIRIDQYTHFHFFDAAKTLEDEICEAYVDHQMTIRAVAAFLEVDVNKVYRTLKKKALIRAKER